MSDPNIIIQRQIQDLQDGHERLRKADVPGVAGTYTPTYLGNTTAGVTTYTTQQGAWIRIGKAVIVTGTVIWTNATGTGFAAVGLPFTAANIANQNFSGSLRVDSVTFANGTPQIVLLPNTSAFLMLSPLTNAASTALNVEAAGDIVFTIMYFID